MIFSLILVFIIIIILEVPELIKKQYWRELVAFFSLLIVAFSLALAQILEVPIPNPMSAMEYLVKDILHLNYK